MEEVEDLFLSSLTSSPEGRGKNLLWWPKISTQQVNWYPKPSSLHYFPPPYSHVSYVQSRPACLSVEPSVVLPPISFLLSEVWKAQDDFHGLSFLCPIYGAHFKHRPKYVEHLLYVRLCSGYLGHIVKQHKIPYHCGASLLAASL